MDAADALPPDRTRATVDGRERAVPRGLRTASWRGRDDVVVLVARDGSRPVSVRDLRVAVDVLGLQGVRRIVTGALHAHELTPWSDAGFVVHERLHLLEHDLAVLPRLPPLSARLRRGRRTDHPAALAVDARGFDPFWRLDQVGLDDAIRATSVARFRVAVDAEVIGYAVTGRSGDRGYLQRLAVDPDRRGEGLGRALVLDGLHWLSRRRVQSAVVNTQVGNDAALALYRSLGFVPQPSGLTVLTIDTSAWR